MSLQIVHQEETLVVAVFESVFFSIWWATPTVPQLSCVYEHRIEYSKDRESFALMSVIKTEKVRSLTPEAKQVATETRKTLQRCTAEANIIEAGGVGISIGRLLFAAMNLINRTKHPTQLFSSLSDGVGWLAPYGKVSAPALLAAVQEASHPTIREAR